MLLLRTSRSLPGLLAALTLSVAGLSLNACGDDESATATTTATSSSTVAGGNGGAGAAATTGVGGGSTTSTGGMGGAGGATAQTNDYLYVANRGSDTVSMFTIDDAGALTDIGDVTVSAPGPMKASTDQRFLYVGLGPSDEVATYAIDAGTGQLTAVGSPVDVGIRPVYVLPHPSRPELLVASYGDNSVGLYSLNADGSVNAQLDIDMPGTNPHSVTISPSGMYAYAPNTNSDTITRYDLSTAGALGSPTDTNVAGGMVGPRHMAYHPTLPILYAVNEHDDSVTAYDVAGNGGLSVRENLTTLPGGFDGNNNTCADIHITRDGKYVYASNRGHDSIAMYTVSAAGDLTINGHAPTEARPREFDVTPDGRFAYVAGQDSAMLAAYSIDAQGQLVALTSYNVGTSPLWVEAVSVPVSP